MIYKLSKLLIKSCLKRRFSTEFTNFKPPWKVLFFGTDHFSLASLKALTSEYRKRNVIDRLEVVTSFKNKLNPIFKFGTEENLVLHRWPIEDEVKGFDVGLVVSFGYLIPEKIIGSFPLGMLNVHASLLPRWRGAAPIIYSLSNGDSKTGVSIMRIKPKHFDIGEILNQEEMEIPEDMTQPVLYKELSELGAKALINSIQNLIENLSNSKPQDNFGISYAPKITNTFAHVKFKEKSAKDVYNLSRALEGIYPLTTKFNNIHIKLYKVKLCKFGNSKPIGFVVYDKNEGVLKVKCADQNWISVENIGIFNKKIMKAVDFNNGYLKKEKESCRIFE